ncbi:MAG: hypothetical protein RLZZ543_1658, partial [Bacteroidota bacterium]
MIEINHISKTFHAGTAREVKAVNDVNLQLEAGSFTLLLGSNGSGKSTLLNLLAGTTLPDAGNIRIQGKEIQGLPAYKRSASIARIFQDPTAGTAPDLSLIDNFRLAALRTKTKGFQLGVNSAFRQQVAEHISVLG